MTRGKVGIIKNDDFWISFEHNGDMYLNGHGYPAIEMLEKVKTEEDYIERFRAFCITEFGYENFQLSEIIEDGYEDLCSHKKILDEKLDLRPVPLRWTDYLYIKNIGDKPCTLIQRDDSETVIWPNEIAVINFGEKISYDLKKND